MYQKDKSPDSKINCRQASNPCKRVFEGPKLAHANKTKGSITSQKLGFRDFWQINGVLNKGKSAIPPIQQPEVLSSTSDKAKLFAKTFLRTLILMTQVSLYLFFPSRTHLKLHNISVTSKMVKGIWSQLCSSGGSKEL